MRMCLGYFFAVLASVSCTLARHSADSADVSPDQTRILDIDCTATSPEAHVTNLRGRVKRLPGSSEKVSGGVSFSNSHQAATVTSLWGGEVSGTLSEDKDQVAIHLISSDVKSPLRHLRIRSGRDPELTSVLSVNALPDTKLQCTTTRFSPSVVSRIFPACNGAGTKTAGWYVDGKLITHDPGCANQVAGCVSDQQGNGWRIFTKTNRRAVAYSRCSSEQIMPQCEQAGTAFQGWYLGGKLISADGQCHVRGISCEELGTKREGWYSHERMLTRSLQPANCASVGQQMAAPSPRPSRTTTIRTGNLSH